MATIKLIGSDGCSFTTDGIEKVMIKCGDDFQPLQDSGLCIVLMERITPQTKTIIRLKDEITKRDSQDHGTDGVWDRLNKANAEITRLNRTWEAHHSNCDARFTTLINERDALKKEITSLKESLDRRHFCLIEEIHRLEAEHDEYMKYVRNKPLVSRVAELEKKHANSDQMIDKRLDALENNPMILLYSPQPQTFTTTGPIDGTTTTSATTGPTITSGTQENHCKNCQDMAAWVKAMKILNPPNSQYRGAIQSPCILCKNTYRPEGNQYQNEDLL